MVRSASLQRVLTTAQMKHHTGQEVMRRLQGRGRSVQIKQEMVELGRLFSPTPFPQGGPVGGLYT